VVGLSCRLGIARDTKVSKKKSLLPSQVMLLHAVTINTILLLTIFIKLHKAKNATALNKAEIFSPSYRNKRPDFNLEVILHE
jgi:hypothetical protein